MVYIITGAVNSGKTTRLLALYDQLRRGDGFALPKYYIGGDYAGQHIVRLSTRQHTVFSVKNKYKPADWDEAGQYKSHSFSKKGHDFAYAAFDEMASRRISPIFMDEIGPLELCGKGFSSMLSAALLENLPLYLVVRTGCLPNVLDRFQIRNYATL